MSSEKGRTFTHLQWKDRLRIEKCENKRRSREKLQRLCVWTAPPFTGKRTHIYYCHPYSAFERGSNENGNRMIRRKVPKGTDFTSITVDDTLRVQWWVNEYPRGILGGRCAARVLMELAQKAGIAFVDNAQKRSLDFSAFNP